MSTKRLSLARDTGASAGFTLVEIMVVIVIIGLLVALVAPNVLGRAEEADLRIAKIDVGQIKDAVVSYMLTNRRIPGWEDLLTPDARGHKYIEREDPKLDPWGNEYQITTDPDFENKPLVVSYGPDGLADTEDDITSKNVTQNKER